MSLSLPSLSLSLHPFSSSKRVFLPYYSPKIFLPSFPPSFRWNCFFRFYHPLLLPFFYFHLFLSSLVHFFLHITSFNPISPHKIPWNCIDLPLFLSFSPFLTHRLSFSSLCLIIFHSFPISWPFSNGWDSVSLWMRVKDGGRERERKWIWEKKKITSSQMMRRLNEKKFLGRIVWSRDQGTKVEEAHQRKTHSLSLTSFLPASFHQDLFVGFIWEEKNWRRDRGLNHISRGTVLEFRIQVSIRTNMLS